AMGMRGYIGSPAEREDRKERRRSAFAYVCRGRCGRSTQGFYCRKCSARLRAEAKALRDKPRRDALAILERNVGEWVAPGRYSARIPWQTFRAVVRSHPHGEWRHGTRKCPAQCRIAEPAP